MLTGRLLLTNRESSVQSLAIDFYKNKTAQCMSDLFKPDMNLKTRTKDQGLLVRSVVKDNQAYIQSL